MQEHRLSVCLSGGVDTNNINMRGNEVAAVGSGANIDQPAEGNGHLCLIIDAAASMQQQTYYGVYYGV